jgi:Zn-dependent M28 family amino/carboxypeptidase
VNHRTRNILRIGALAASAAVCGSLAIAVPAQAAVAPDTQELRDAVTVDGVMSHLDAFQAIADANGDNRAAGTPGHDASVDYVEGLLQDAGYDTWRQEFTYERTDFGDSALQQTSPNLVDYVLGVDFFPMDFAGEGDTTAPVTAVDVNIAGDHATTSGCEAGDFAGFPVGNIALIQRGACNFSVKADNAINAGASGVIIFNQGNVVPGDDRLGLFGGTLGEPVRTIPVVSAPYALGAEWVNTSGLMLRLNLEAEVVQVTTENLLADTPTGRTDRTVVVGGHLDSVAEGPGINDNGSGTATILETALQMADLGIDPKNRVRFAFWSGEEDGLIGSSFYVSQLTPSEVKGTALNLNFDMVGSPNSVNFVYDGDGDALGVSGPNGSGVIEDVFTDFFGDQGESSEPTDFDGRSDNFGFIEAGIPAGGLFTGAEVPKTIAEAALYGGVAGAAYDPCYHAFCDNLTGAGQNAALYNALREDYELVGNINVHALDVNSDAIATAVLSLAYDSSAVNAVAGKPGKSLGLYKPGATS